MLKYFFIMILKGKKECYEYEISDSEMNKRFRLFRIMDIRLLRDYLEY